MPYRNVSIRLSCAFLMECACALMSPHFAAAAGQAPSYQGKDDAANRAAEIQTVPKSLTPPRNANRHWGQVQFSVLPLPSRGDLLSALSGYSPGLASDLILFATTKFDCQDCKQPAAKTQKASPSKASIVVGPSGQVTITPPAGEATTTLQQAAAQCKPPSGANSQPVPTTIGEALNEIDTNGADQCHDQHVSELAYGLIARSDALCRSYVGTLSFDQRSYRTIFSIAGAVFGAVGTVVAPAKVFSALAGLSSGVSSSIDAGAYSGEAGHILAGAILASQAESRATLNVELGLDDGSTTKTSSGSTSTSASAGTSGNTITVAYTLPTPAVPAVKAVPAKAGRPAIPAKPGVPAKPGTTTITLGDPSAGRSSKTASESSAKAKVHFAGTVFDAVNAYHQGCTVQAGLFYLQNKVAPGASKVGSSTTSNDQSSAGGAAS